MTSVHLHQSPVHQYNNKVHYCLCYNPMLAVILLTFNSMAIKCEEAVFLMLMVALSKVECHDSKKASWDSCWHHFWRSGVSWPHASSTSPCWGKWICSHDSSLCRRSLGPSWSAIRRGKPIYPAQNGNDFHSFFLSTPAKRTKEFFFKGIVKLSVF